MARSGAGRGHGPLGNHGRKPFVNRLDWNGDGFFQHLHKREDLFSLGSNLAGVQQWKPNDDAARADFIHKGFDGVRVGFGEVSGKLLPARE